MTAASAAILAVSIVSLPFLPHRSQSAALRDASEREGRAINETGFWRRARRRKAAFAGIATIEIAVRAFGTAWHASLGENGAINDAINAVTWTIILSIALLSISTRNTAKHWRQIVALSTLTTLTTLALVLELLTTTLRHLEEGQTTSNRANLVFSALNTVLSFIALAIISTAPGGPARHYSKEKLAGAQPAVAITTIDAPETVANVSEIVETSPLGWLTFSWATTLVNAGASITAANMPFIQSALRTKRLFEEARASAKTGGTLFRRVWQINRTYWIVQSILAIICCFLYYLPACAFPLFAAI